MNLFTRAKAALATLKRTFNRVGTDLLKQAVHTGKALVGAQDRDLSPQEWIRWYCGGNKRAFAAPTKRSGNDGRGDTYGRAQRQRAALRNRKGPNYAKVARAMAKFNGVPATTFVQRGVSRDALTGVVS